MQFKHEFKTRINTVWPSSTHNAIEGGTENLPLTSGQEVSVFVLPVKRKKKKEKRKKVFSWCSPDVQSGRNLFREIEFSPELENLAGLVTYEQKRERERERSNKLHGINKSRSPKTVPHDPSPGPFHWQTRTNFYRSKVPFFLPLLSLFF